MRPKRVSSESLPFSRPVFLSVFPSLCLTRLRNWARMTEQSNRLLNKRCRPTCRAVYRVSVLSPAPRREKYMTSDSVCTPNERYVRMTKSQSVPRHRLSAYFNVTLIFTFNFDYVIIVTFTPRAPFLYLLAYPAGASDAAHRLILCA